MNPMSIRKTLALSLLSLAFAGAGQAAPMEMSPGQYAQVDDFAAGKQAIENKDWSLAVRSFNKVVAQDPQNADAYNLLGYSSRWLGRYEDAFAAYAKALALNPKHRGALNYSGIAYLKTGQKDRAEGQLAKLQESCANCDETPQLAKAIADYKPAAP